MEGLRSGTFVFFWDTFFYLFMCVLHQPLHSCFVQRILRFVECVLYVVMYGCVWLFEKGVCGVRGWGGVVF